MASRYYSSVAALTTLSNGVSAGGTSFIVGSTSGFPVQTPFTLLIDEGTTSEEIVTVTAVAGLTLTVTRGEDGTVAVAHDPGARVRHAMTARDLRESREHEAATTNVHGVSDTSNLVTKSGVETLSNKTLVSPTINTPVISRATSSPGTGQTALSVSKAAQDSTAPHILLDAVNTAQPSASRHTMKLAPGAWPSPVFEYRSSDYLTQRPGSVDIQTEGRLQVRQQDIGSIGATPTNASLVVQGGRGNSTNGPIASFQNGTGVEVASIDKDGNIIANAVAVPDTWLNLTMQNSWTTGTGSSLLAVKNFGSWGMIRGTATPPGSSNASATVIATLPAGMVPSFAQYFSVPTSSGGATVHAIRVMNNGEVQIFGALNSSSSLFISITYAR